MTDGLPGGGAAGNISIGSAAFKPEDPNTIYLSLGDMMPGSANGTAEGRGFFISGDGGETWARGGALGNTTRTKTVLALPGNIVLVAGNGGVYRSTDGGLTFQKCWNPLPPPHDSSDFEYCRGWDILRLDNGDLVASVEYTGRWYIGETLYPEKNSDIIYSTDSGATWAKAAQNASFPHDDVRRVALAAHGLTVYGLFQVGNDRNFPNGLMKSTDGGRTWFYQEAPTLFSYGPSGFGVDGGQAGYNHMIAVDPDDPSVVFVGANLSVYRSKDGGLTFTP